MFLVRAAAMGAPVWLGFVHGFTAAASRRHVSFSRPFVGRVKIA